MFNKKRLAMMAMAASMVLPTNLVAFSTSGSVFAEEMKELETQNTGITDSDIKELSQKMLDDLLKEATKDSLKTLPVKLPTKRRHHY